MALTATHKAALRAVVAQLQEAQDALQDLAQELDYETCAATCDLLEDIGHDIGAARVQVETRLTRLTQ